MFGSIYILSMKDLQTPNKYLEKNLKKRFMKKSKLLVEYLIFSILKKNQTL